MSGGDRPEEFQPLRSRRRDVAPEHDEAIEEWAKKEQEDKKEGE